MDIEETLKDILEDLLKRLEIDYSKIEVSKDEDTYFINISSENPSLLIGYRGTNIQALQHVLKVLAWKKCENEQFNILLDIDEYRKRQEENALSFAERKIEGARRFKKPQRLPPMPAYLRRKIHMLCMGAGYEDIETLSEGEGEERHIIIKLKS